MDKTAIEPWLIAWRLNGIGPSVFSTIIERYGHPGAFLDASEADRKAQGFDAKICMAPRKIDAVREGVAADLAWLEAADDHHIIPRGDPRYPPLLADIADPPPLLFLRGQPSALLEPQIGIVGARNATTNGIRAAEDFAAHLAATGLAITSGLALGIDAAAHEGAMAVNGRTIAVMATGPEQVYPRENEKIGQAICENGAIITEMAVGTPVKRGLFPRRNRIISGLSLGVLVVEAGRKSGALGTAYAAVDQDREVMAIPGSIHNPLARGCHALIRNGARLVETVDDVIEEVKALQGRLSLAPQGLNEPVLPASKATDAGSDALDTDYQALLNAMGHDPIGFDQLCERLSLTPDILSSMLLSLELKGYIAPCNGGRYMRTNNRAGG